VTPVSLADLSFLAGVGGALTAPAVQFTVAAKSCPKAGSPGRYPCSTGIGVTIQSRAVGRLGGVITAAGGNCQPPFGYAVQAISRRSSAALLWWPSGRTKRRGGPNLARREFFWGGIAQTAFATPRPQSRIARGKNLDGDVGLLSLPSRQRLLGAPAVVAAIRLVGGGEPALYGVGWGAKLAARRRRRLFACRAEGRNSELTAWLLSVRLEQP